MTDGHTGLECDEIHHRFLNTLAALRGLLRRDFAAFEDVRVLKAVMTFDGQLMAFANVHQSLRGARVSQNIDVPTHFARLCAQLGGAHLAPHGHHCEFSADEGEIHPDAGEKLGLIIAELLTNCAKHAFPDRSPGRVSVSFRRGDDGWTCIVQDNGCGVRPAGQVGQTGQGLRLIQKLANAIEAEVAFHSDDKGVRVTVRLPETDLVDFDELGHVPMHASLRTESGRGGRMT